MRTRSTRWALEICLILFAVSLAVAPATVRGASITVYTSQAEFNAAVVPNQTITFNSLPVGFGLASPFTQGPVTITADGQLPIFAPPGSLGFTTNFLSKGTEPFSIDFAAGVTGVGMQIASPVAVTVTVTAYDGMIVQVPFQASTVTFLGFSSPAGIKSITFADDHPTSESIINIGDITLGTVGLCLEDESGGSVLRIDPTTGDYLYTKCDGLTLTGRGTVTRKGETITLQHNAPDRRVVVRIVGSGRRGTASIQLLSTGRTETITDKDLSNSVCACR